MTGRAAIRRIRALAMVNAAIDAGFGHCTNLGECAAVCPKDIRLEVIARMNRDFLCAGWRHREEAGAGGE